MNNPNHSVAEKIKALHDAGWSIAELATLIDLDRPEVEHMARTGRNSELSD